MECSETDCQNKSISRGLCKKHYEYYWKRGLLENTGGPGSSRTVEDGLKWCAYHRDTHPEEMFTPFETTCKEGKTLRHIFRQYKLTESEYKSMLGICPICLEREVKYVDHDHSCCAGKSSCGSCVRGVLCPPCSTAIAQFGDDPAIMLRAIEYLTNNRSNKSVC